MNKLLWIGGALLVGWIGYRLYTGSSVLPSFIAPRGDNVGQNPGGTIPGDPAIGAEPNHPYARSNA